MEWYLGVYETDGIRKRVSGPPDKTHPQERSLLCHRYGESRGLHSSCGVWGCEVCLGGKPHYMLSGNELHYLSFFSLPEVKWLLTNPKEVPLNINDTPTAPLFPKGRGEGESQHNRQPWQVVGNQGGAVLLIRRRARKAEQLLERETQRWQGLGGGGVPPGPEENWANGQRPWESTAGWRGEAAVEVILLVPSQGFISYPTGQAGKTARSSQKPPEAWGRLRQRSPGLGGLTLPQLTRFLVGPKPPLRPLYF